MLPFLLLVIVFLLARFLGWAGVAYLGVWQHCLRVALAAMFLLTASAHWGKRRADLVRMVPPNFPRPELLVTLTGIAEIAGALGLLWAPAVKAASVCLAVLLAALFPANVYAGAASTDYWRSTGAGAGGADGFADYFSGGSCCRRLVLIWRV